MEFVAKRIIFSFAPIFTLTLVHDAHVRLYEPKNIRSASYAITAPSGPEILAHEWLRDHALMSDVAFGQEYKQRIRGLVTRDLLKKFFDENRTRLEAKVGAVQTACLPLKLCLSLSGATLCSTSGTGLVAASMPVLMIFLFEG